MPIKVMLDPNGNNRGSGFVAFSTPEEASQAATCRDEWEDGCQQTSLCCTCSAERRQKGQVAGEGYSFLHDLRCIDTENSQQEKTVITGWSVHFLYRGCTKHLSFHANILCDSCRESIFLHLDDLGKENLLENWVRRVPLSSLISSMLSGKVVEDFAAENVVYLELRTTPKIKRDMNQTKETSIWRRQGRREFRVTYLCTDRETKQAFACKSISKKKLPTTVDVEDVRQEVAIMSTLPEHPNIVKLCATYEDHEAVHLVMELCEGRGLFDRIVARGHYSE
ncbi:hypothetical protein L2E82_28646 [Cichorium intybus]|uniref:Uncharacterized protein n=1 Tax=Cichorium intybus TaxID=13427 RepID=A0ACB9CWB2_CICIN|nr:hypothetical protein L2E82_28646 [Cichorium intybus]